MPIVFDEISAEVAPQAENQRGSGGSGSDPPSADAQPADSIDNLRSILALLREREARCSAD